MKRLILFVLLGLCSVLFVSCFQVNYEEVMTLESNGSGKVDMTLDFPASQMEGVSEVMNQLMEAIELTPGIGIRDAYVKKGKGGQARAHGVIDFQYPTDLTSLKENYKKVYEKKKAGKSGSAQIQAEIDAGNALLGSVDWEIKDWKTWEVRRKLDFEEFHKMLPMKALGQLSEMFGAKGKKVEEMSKFRFKLILPEKLENNAEERSEDGKTLSWSVNPFLEKNLEMKYDVRPLIPPWLKGIVYGILFGGVIGSVFIFWSKKKKRAKKKSLRA